MNLTISSDRTEVGEEITLTASVRDDETAADELKYEWQAASGTILGTGQVVTWKAPTTEPTPATYTVSLSVVERYASGEQTLEHRVTATSPDIHVNDSPNEVRAVSQRFLDDFSNSSVSPETCVQNFSDSCPGKRSELKDIIDNRRVYTILSSKFSNFIVSFNRTRTTSRVTLSCIFRSKFNQGGAIEVADGTCKLDLIYENYRWWLCNSSYDKLSAAGPNFIF